MFRHFQSIYILVVTDLAISTLLILLFQENVSGVLAVNLTIRPIIVLIITLFSFWICSKLKFSRFIFEILSSFLMTYLLTNCIIFALKSNNKGLIETTMDIHKNWTLFSFLMLPLIISYCLLMLVKIFEKNKKGKREIQQVMNNIKYILLLSIVRTGNKIL